MPSIDVDIAKQFLHPPIGLLVPHLDYHGPYSGNVTVTTWSTTPGPIYTNLAVSESFGVLWQVNGSIPVGRGFVNGWASPDGLYEETVYTEPLAQLVVQHQFLSGAWVTTQSAWIRSFPGAMLWQEALPGRVGLLVSPGIELDLFFLLIN